MAPRVDQALIAELLGGDPLLTSDEAAAQLGMTPDEVDALAAAGTIPSIQVARDSTHGRGVRRYRQSAITAAMGLSPGGSTG